jgi:hypothetical protein
MLTLAVRPGGPSQRERRIVRVASEMTFILNSALLLQGLSRSRAFPSTARRQRTRDSPHGDPAAHVVNGRP